MTAELLTTPVLTDPRVAAAIELVWREAALLDAREYEAWDRLWAPGGLYVIPIDPAAETVEDFDARLNLVYDDDRMRRMRIARLVEGYSISAVSAARTARTVASFVVDAVDDSRVELTSAQTLVGHKRDQTIVLGARLAHHVVSTPDGPRIQRKVIRLVNSDQSVTASGFLL